MGDWRMSRLDKRKWVVPCLIMMALLSACQESSDLSLDPLWSHPAPSPTLTPFQPVLWTAAPGAPTNTPSPTPLLSSLFTPSPTCCGEPDSTTFSLYASPAIQSAFLPAVHIPEDLSLTTDSTTASLKIFVGDDYPVSQWIYALVAPFPTLADGVTSKELRAAWKGNPRGQLNGLPLMMDEATLNMLSTYWGEPADGSVKIVTGIAKPDYKPDFQHTSWAIIPFDALNPRWKVLSIDGISPIHRDFEAGNYELAIPISMTGVAPELPRIPSSNRDAQKMTILAMTGVTALVRATAFTMEQQGATYPAVDIGPILRAADITHVSNEVPFAENCPYPNPVQEGVKFCSRPQYIELLEDVSTDIVELTGDHFADWGAGAMLYTLDLYDQRGWHYYGGGANFKEGRRPVVIEHNGNKLAFIGCNAKGGGFATASENNPGAVYCDWDWMQNKISDLRAEDYLPIATFQHFEYYTYAAQPNQIRDAKRMTEAGAVIVSGSQAHQPQAFEFSQDGFVHHGLGNLFFDQLDVSEATRQGFVDLHIFYDGRYISTELVTIYFIDYARARLMTPEERTALLTTVFSASGW
jgi:poly-gamma-glutamate synthesis protein (capsule biosynthesis protein)